MSTDTKKKLTKRSSIKLVFKRDTTWTCGMCRSEYASIKPAKACLKECLARLVQTQPIRPKRSGFQTEYACNLCARTHSEQPDALSCAKACYAELQERQSIEAKVLANESSDLIDIDNVA